jgi:hypothetical protein
VAVRRSTRWRGERTLMTDGVSSGRRPEVAWWLGSNYGSGVQRPCARWRGTWKPTWRWARCGRRQQLGSGQSELEAGAVGASSALRCTEEKGKSARAPGERKEGGRGRGPAKRHSREDTGSGSGPGPELGARTTERGRAAHEQGEKPKRERGRARGGCQVGPTQQWDPLVEREAGRGRCGWPAQRWGPTIRDGEGEGQLPRGARGV